MIYLYGCCFCANLLEGMGSSGKVVNLVVGKEVTAINGQFQKTYIGTPTANLSLTLEEGSKLSSIGNDAFKDNTFFVSIDLSNSAQDMTFNNNAFYNMANLIKFATGSGTLTLGTNSLANLTKCEEFTLNAKNTVFSTDMTLTLTNGNTAVALSSITGAAKTTYTFYATGWTNWRSSRNDGNVYIQHANSATITLNPATPTVTTALTATTKTAAAYTITYVHPLTNLSKDSKCVVKISESVETIPDNLFCSGIVARTTTSTPTHSLSGKAQINTTSYSTTVYTTSYHASLTTSNSTYAARTLTVNAGSVSSTISTSASNDTIDVFADSGISVEKVLNTSDSMKLTKVGKNTFGVEERTASVNLDLSTTSTTTLSGAPTMASHTNLIVARYQSGSYPATSGNTTIISATPSSTATVTAANRNATATIKTQSSSRSSTALASVLDTVSSHVEDVCISATGDNCIIDNSAFAYNAGLTNIRIGSGAQTINDAAFYRIADASTAFIYGKASNTFKPDSNNGLTSGGHSDIGTIVYLEDAKDLGRYIAHYQIGTNVTAYLFELVDGTYVINIVGTGPTYDTYTASNLPDWHSTYGTKVSKVIVDDTVTGIGPYLFYGHTALTSVQFGTGLTSIGAHAFGNCTGLDSFTVPSTLTSVGERILEGAAVKTVYYNANTEDAYHSMSGCDANEIILGANVTKIGDGTLGDISGDFFVKAKKPRISRKTFCSQ